MTKIRFDDALPAMVRILREKAGDRAIEEGTILRDASGRLSFFSLNQEANFKVDEVEKIIRQALGSYAQDSRLIVFSNQPGAGKILHSQDRLPIEIDGNFCNLLDRRIVGAGWLETPEGKLATPPRVAFSTLKGGVGRTTALVIAAADLARRNKNVLVVDLDLEAPGLGDMILDAERLPKYGAVDFLVEDGLSGIQNSELQDFVGTSGLTASGGGRVDVMPALGSTSTLFPENIMAKLSRAMLEDITENGTISVRNQISSMIDRLGGRENYDVILIDSRAGLSELAAPAVLGLGATVLMFGTAQKQTLQGYRGLFSALQLLAQRDRALGGDAEWRSALRPVYAKASMNAEVGRRFQEEFYELYSQHIYDAETTAKENADTLRFALEDQNAPHWPIAIAFSQNFLDFDPERQPSQLTSEFYDQAFRPFLNHLDKIIATPSNSISS